MNDHLERNRRAWDERASGRKAHTRTASDRDLRDPLRSLDPDGWLGGSIAGLRVLCLGSGGGLQSIFAAAAGAEVTVVDLSPRMLEQDRAEAARRGLVVRTIESSMERVGAVASASVDLILQPVSTCYVPGLRVVYGEAARMLRPGGLYVSQHKQPASLQARAVWSATGYPVTLPCDRCMKLPPEPEGVGHREAGSVEFLHTWEELIGEMCRSGFVVEDLVEPFRGDRDAAPGTFEHRSAFLPPYVRIKARRAGAAAPDAAGALWVPA